MRIPALLLLMTFVAAACAPVAQAGSGTGTWYQYTPLARSGQGAVYDPVGRRMLIMGGTNNRSINDLRALSLNGPLAWTRLDTPVTNMPSLGAYFPVHDADRSRIVAVSLVNLGSGYAISLGSPPLTSPLTFTGAPTSRSSMSMVLDPVGKRILLFGGSSSSTYLNDVWQLSLATLAWQKLTPIATPPPGRRSAGLAFDAARNQLVVVGGFGLTADPFAPATNLSDVWTLTLGGTPQWSSVTPSGAAPAQGGARTVFDAVRDRVLVFWGTVIGVVTFSPSPAWSSLPGAPNWTSYSVVLDPIGNRVVAFGGVDQNAFLAVWSKTMFLDLSTGTWTTYDPTFLWPSAAQQTHLVVDPVRNRVLLFYGGTSVWSFDFATGSWTDLGAGGAPSGSAPSKWAYYDPYQDRVLIYAAFNGTPQLWTLSLGSTPEWTQLSLGVAKPPPGRVVTYDPRHNRLLGYFGAQGTWQLDLAVPPDWVQIATLGTPPPTGGGYVGVYDPLRDCYVVSGGGATWTLDFGNTPASWQQIVPSGSTPGQCSQTGVFDPAGHQVASFGGSVSAFSEVNSTSVLPLAASSSWSTLAPLGQKPDARFNHALAYDANHDQLLVFGGTDDFSDFSDFWGLVWGTSIADVTGESLPQVAPGGHIRLVFTVTNHTLYDQPVNYTLKSARLWPGFPINGSMTAAANAATPVSFDVQVPIWALSSTNDFTFDAVLPGLLLKTTGTLSLVTTLGVEATEAGKVLLSRAGTNPGRRLDFLISLPGSGACRLDVFDITGRRIFTRDVGLLGAGTHTVAVDASLPPGVYEARLLGTFGRRSLRAVVTR